VANESDSLSVAGDRFELGALGGVHFFNADHGLGRFINDPQDLSPATGFAFGGRVSWAMVPRLALEAELLASPTHTRNSASSMWVLGYRLNLLFNLLTEGTVRPFVLIGAGALSSLVAHQNVVSNDTDPFLHAGVGAKFCLGETWGLRLDGRVLVPPAIFSKIGSMGDETKYSGPDFEILASIYLVLGRPVRPEPIAPPPPPVDPDPDHDGILGDADKCPNEPEDKDGFEDEDGCPDPDNDGDGIPDVKDKCPNEPETVNGYQDEDGCPDEVPAPVKKFIGVIQGINFAYDEATLLPSSFAILDKAVTMMSDFPQTRFEVSGHTDYLGTPEYNHQLSQRRAQAVVDYMVKKGVAADRLTAVAYGQDRPIADNGTPGGRAQNRRTEFKLISEPAKWPQWRLS